jgi:S1/P1 Nuclease
MFKNRITKTGIKTTISFSISIFLVTMAALPSYSWFDFGHMEVACVAYKHLNPKTRARALDLLKLNPYYQRWLAAVPAGASEDERDLLVFEQAATWPDVIKGDKTYISDGTNGGHRADAPDAGQNIGYADHSLHKYWHFTDTPFSTDSTPLPEIEKYNAQTQIQTFRKAIASDCSDEVKSYDLTWLMHLVGDVHQPLHCSMRVSHDDREGDAGGNKVKLFNERGGPDNLHSFWDGLPGTERVPDHVEAAAKTLHKSSRKLTAKMDEKVWIDESFRYAQKSVYTGPIKNGDGPFRITGGYKRRAEDISQERVELAGERLANLLNTELK